MEIYLLSDLSLSFLRFEVGFRFPGWVDVDIDIDDRVGDSK